MVSPIFASATRLIGRGRGSRPAPLRALPRAACRARRRRLAGLHTILPLDMNSDAHPGPHAPVDQPDVHDHALVGVVKGVEHERLERRLGVAHRGRNALDDGLEHVGNAGAVLGRDGDGLIAVEPEHLRDLVPRALHVRRGQVDLVDDRDDLEAAVRRQVEVRQGLRLDPLGGVDDQDARPRRRRASARPRRRSRHGRVCR